jgi:hypothetical protein
MSLSSALLIKMKENKIYSKEAYAKDRSHFGFWASLPIWISILSLIGEIFIQSTLSLKTGMDTDLMFYSTPQTIGLTFSSAALAIVSLSNQTNLKLVLGISGMISILFALILIIFSSYSLKGKGHNIFICAIVYGIDTLCLIPLIILSASGKFGISLRPVDYSLQIAFHLIFLVLLIYVSLVEKRMKEYESLHKPKSQPLFTNDGKENKND